MKKILKESFIWFLPFFAFILLMFSLNIVIKDFKYAHTSHMVFKPAYNWIPYYKESFETHQFYFFQQKNFYLKIYLKF